MLNHLEIALLIEELKDWRGAALQKIQQAAVDHVGLGLRRRGETGWLHLRLQRGNLRFYLSASKATALARPPAFSMALRKHLVGARLVAVNQPEGERIAHFVFARGEETTTLVVELLPPGGNVVLVHENGRILARLFNDERSGTVGRTYQAPEPPPPTRVTVRPWSGPSFHTFLAEQDHGAEPWAVDDDAQRNRARHEAKRAALLKRLEQDWQKAGDPAVWRTRGELLAANPQVETRDRSEVTLTSPEGEKTVVPVDPRLTLSQNVEAYFRKAKKASTARRHITERRALVESGRWEPGRRPQPTARASGSGGTAGPAGSQAGLPPGHVFRFPGGSILAVGRSAKENDRLTFGWARPQDYWTHVRGVQGAHVLARHSAGDDLDEVLEAAARLALHYSSRRGERAGDVQQVQRRYVQSMRGAPGLVRLMQDENRRVTLTDEDLRHLDALRVKR